MPPNEKTIQTLEAEIIKITHSRDLWKAAALELQAVLQASGWSPYTEGQKAIDAVKSLLRSESND